MTINVDNLREIERLKARIEELEYELDSLKSTVDTEVMHLMDNYDLTAAEARMIRALAHAAGAPLSRPVLIEVLDRDIDNLRSVDSHVKRVRAKVGGLLPIDSIYGIGYRLLPETAKHCREVMAGKVRSDRHRAHFYGHGQTAA